MTKPELIDLLRRLTYKPEVRLVVHDLDDHVSFQAVLVVEDTLNPPRIVEVDMGRTFYPPVVERDEVLDVVRRMIHDLEKHEADEWLKLDGVAWCHPHPGARP